MKIAFINTPLQNYTQRKRQEYYTAPSLGLGYLATIAQNLGHEVSLLDGEALGLSPQEVADSIKSSGAEVVGINLLTPTVTISKDIVQRIKEANSNIKVIAGGPHATIQPEQSLRRIPGIDILVRGEGEATLEELLNQDLSIGSTKGVSYIQEGQIIHNQDRELSTDLDALPFIDRNFFVNDPYREGKHLKSVVIGSRGCIYHCTFCAGPNVSGRKMRGRSVENIVDEIETLKDQYGVKNIHLMDNDFTYSKDKMLEFADEMQRRDLNVGWRALARVNQIARFGKPLLEKLKQSGCYQLVFGIESGNQRILNLIRKGTTPQQAEEAVKLCREVGIKSKGFYMFGFPGETKAEMNQTLEHARKLNTDVACFLLVKSYPGTEMYDQLAKTHSEAELQDYTHLQEAIPKESISAQDRKLLSNLEGDGIYVNNFIKYNLRNSNPISDIGVKDLVGTLRKAYKMYYLDGGRRE